jgi:putative acetyltransferase
MEIRSERDGDAHAIRAVTTSAFLNAPHTSHTEAAIVDALRASGALAISLVAEDDGEVIGHVAFSPVTINGDANGWYGLGPVSVRPDRQRRGIGRALIREGLDRLRRIPARGLVVLGDPSYYVRFGFVSDPRLRYPNVPPEYFQSLAFGETVPQGEVSYHAAFEAR